MGNRATLMPLNTLSKEDRQRICSMGGKAAKNVFKVVTRRKCNPNCKMWDNCWAQSASAQFEGKCALARAPEIVSRRTVKAVTGGEQGWVELMSELLTEIEAKVRQNPTAENLIKLNKEFRETFPVIFGTRQRINAKVETVGEGGIMDIEAQVRSVLNIPRQVEVVPCATMKMVSDLVDGEGLVVKDDKKS